MSARSLRSQRFRAEREDSWRELERILRKAEKKSINALTDEELLALPILYRGALSALATARATSLDAALAEYLESLAARAYFFVYGVRGKAGERLTAFLFRALPAAVKDLWRETLVAATMTFGSAAVSFLLVTRDPQWYYSFVARGMAQGRDPNASAESLHRMLYDGGDDKGLGVFATFLFTHNAQIALACFALGFAFCAPTVFLLAMNGLMLGAFVALYFSKDLGFEIVGWLMIHGVTELFAVVLAGAAGLRIGWTVAFPGPQSRLDAAATAGRRSATVVAGVVIMLMFAGLLEGFGRQLITNDAARYAVAAATAVFWAAWFYLPKRAEAARG